MRLSSNLLLRSSTPTSAFLHRNSSYAPSSCSIAALCELPTRHQIIHQLRILQPTVVGVLTRLQSYNLTESRGATLRRSPHSPTTSDCYQTGISLQSSALLQLLGYHQTLLERPTARERIRCLQQKTSPSPGACVLLQPSTTGSDCDQSWSPAGGDFSLLHINSLFRPLNFLQSSTTGSELDQACSQLSSS